MTVFISWSGQRSKAVALVFKEHLHHVIQGLPTFMSAKDISSGTQWQAEISDKLRQSSFGIICVTPENQESAWLNFEAGAIGNQTEQSRVAPVAIGMSRDNLPSPLSGFNGVDLNEDGFVGLLKSIHSAGLARMVEWPVIEDAARTRWKLMEPSLSDLPETLDEQPGEFDLAGAVKEMRGLLRDLVERSQKADQDSPGLTAAQRVAILRNPGRLATAVEIDPGELLMKPSAGLVATVNNLLARYSNRDANAAADLLALGIDPEERHGRAERRMTLVDMKNAMAESRKTTEAREENGEF